MEGIIKTQIEERSKKDIEELVLDNWKTHEISETDKECLESFKHLTAISFRGSGLTSLRNFPKNKHLIKVELSDNHISEGLEPLGEIPNLFLVSLENNQISSFEVIQPLARLEGLLSLDLHGNPIADDPQYLKRVFELIPSLKALDGLDADGNEVDEIIPEEEIESSEEEEEGEYSLSEEESEEEDFKGTKRAGDQSELQEPEKKTKRSIE